MIVVPSEPLGLEQSVGEVDEQARGNDRRERIIEDHDGFPLQPVAGVDVADRQREKDDADRQQDNVHHGSAPINECPLGQQRTARCDLDLGQQPDNFASLSADGYVTPSA
jgi:hypothetical protein